MAVLAAIGHSHVIYSDDHGESWRIGGVAQTGTNESSVVETADGARISTAATTRRRPPPRVCMEP